MKVAIIHYWLVGMRGGEKVLEALCALFPDADIFTHVLVPDAISDRLRAHTIKTTFINRLPRARYNYKTYLPLMPMALEQLDLRGYDLIISSESGPAKGIIPPPEGVHICYCHTPMRYIWNMYPEYRASAGVLARTSMPFLTHYLRSWDQCTAARVDGFVANSRSVAARIQKYYRRSSTVVHPPVDVESFDLLPADDIGDFYLMVGELVAYKRPDLAVRAFNASGKKLVVIGGGDMLPAIRQLAGPSVEVLGPQPFERLRAYYAQCRALIFPGEEDFGIVPVEAMASGRPVVAFGRGGVLDSVVDGVTGVLFEEQSEESLLDAVARSERLHFNAPSIKAHAQQFNAQRFARQMRAVIQEQIVRQKGATWLSDEAMPSRLPAVDVFEPHLDVVPSIGGRSQRHKAL